MNVTYPAKVLLFGEHTILRGSRALATPFAGRGAGWKQATARSKTTTLDAFATYLDETLPHCFDLPRLRSDLASGWSLATNIPVGYGMGSSGTVCVAVVDRYLTTNGQVLLDQDAKVFFAQMENFFHGASSGTDPLIIYKNHPILLQADGSYQSVELPSRLDANLQFFLLDTGQARETGPLVQHFLKQYDGQTDFRQQVITQWVPQVELAIDSLLRNDALPLSLAFRAISAFQLQQPALAPMVLPKLHTIWQQGLNTGIFYLKICGAGGGGFCLGLSNDWSLTQRMLKSWSLLPVAF